MKNTQAKNTIELEGVITQGHQVASGLSAATPYPKGTIAMQLPFFEERGADFGDIHPATVNISISPHHFKIIKPDYFFEKVEWTDLHPPETFSFVAFQVDFGSGWQPAFIYYPHPETKKTHFSNDTILETLTAYTEGITYGRKVRVRLSLEKMTIGDS